MKINRIIFKLNILDNWTTTIILCSLSYILLFMYVFTALELLKVFAFFVGIVAILLLKKKRVFYLLLLSSFSMILVVNSFAIGSFFTWMLVFYYLCVLIDIIVKKDITSLFSQKTIICFILCICLLISFFLNAKEAELSKTFSLIIYLISPVFIISDHRFEKDAHTMIACLSISFLFSNIFAFSFVYVLKDYSIRFFELVLPKWLKYYQMSNGSFRFSGLNDDPNYNSFLSLFLASLCLLVSIKSISKSQKIFFAFLAIIIQPFAILSMSKTYLIIAVIFILYLVIAIFIIFKINTAYIPISLLALSLLSIPFTILFRSTILRIFSSDTRVGAISSLTTGRSDLFISYLAYFSKNPIRLLIGHGAHAKPIESLNDMHNTLLRILWDCGLVGAIPYCAYFSSFFIFKYSNLKNFLLKLGPIIIFAFYIFALDLASNHIVIFSICSFSFIETYNIKERIGDLRYEIEI